MVIKVRNIQLSHYLTDVTLKAGVPLTDYKRIGGSAVGGSIG